MTFGINTFIPECVRSGKVMATDAQYRRWLTWDAGNALLFERVQVRHDCTMWRYKHAPMPVSSRFEPSKLNPGDEWDYFLLVCLNFLEALREAQPTNLVDGDEDEEFTYGAFCTAIATHGGDESDWLVEKLAGDLYQMTHMHVIEQENNED